MIMKKTWTKGRQVIDYQNVGNTCLMVKFGNKPYVDVRASFNSLLPNNLPKQLRKKLVNFYLKKLKDNQYLHEQVENLRRMILRSERSFLQRRGMAPDKIR